MSPQFAPSEQSVYRRLKTPTLIQRFLDDEIEYNKEYRRATCYSPRLVLRHGVAHCMEGALLAATALRLLGYPPLIMDLEAVRDSDHVLAIYRRNGRWGAIAKSNYAGLRGREPVYKTLRELAMSYFEHYFNPAGEKTLRSHSAAVNLTRFDRMGPQRQGWMTTEEQVWEIPSYLCEIPHKPLMTTPVIRQLSKMDKRLYVANCVGQVDASGAAIRIKPHLRQH